MTDVVFLILSAYHSVKALILCHLSIVLYLILFFDRLLVFFQFLLWFVLFFCFFLAERDIYQNSDSWYFYSLFYVLSYQFFLWFVAQWSYCYLDYFTPIQMLILNFFHLPLSIDVDDCLNHTCQNGASCVDGVNGYSCTCVLGFAGQSCETSRLSFLESHYLWINVLTYFLYQ